MEIKRAIVFGWEELKTFLSEKVFHAPCALEQDDTGYYFSVTVTPANAAGAKMDIAEGGEDVKNAEEPDDVEEENTDSDDERVYRDFAILDRVGAALNLKICNSHNSEDQVWFELDDGSNIELQSGYMVIADSSAVRDAQFYTGAPNDPDMAFNDEDWSDCKYPELVLGIFKAESEEQAVTEASKRNGIDRSFLKAVRLATSQNTEREGLL